MQAGQVYKFKPNRILVFEGAIGIFSVKPFKVLKITDEHMAITYDSGQVEVCSIKTEKPDGRTKAGRAGSGSPIRSLIFGKEGFNLDTEFEVAEGGLFQ